VNERADRAGCRWCVLDGWKWGYPSLSATRAQTQPGAQEVGEVKREEP
jgi:hypothetical protein